MKRVLSRAVLGVAVLALLLVGAQARAAENAVSALDTYLSALPNDFNTVSTAAVQAKIDAGEPIYVLDVREPAEFTAGHLPSAKNVPIRELVKRAAELPADKSTPIVVYCKSGHRGAFGTEALGLMGYKNVKNMAAAFGAWEKEGKPVSK